MTTRTIGVHIVSQRPGNPILRFYVRADRIEMIGEAMEDYAKIGAASSIDTSTGTIYVTENIEDLHAALEESLKELA